MKKSLIVICLLLFITGFAVAQIGPGRTLYVSVKTVQLKASTGVFAGNTGTINYGDEVTVIKTDGKNVEVRSVTNPSLTGWTASQNFSTKKIVVGNAPSATVSEVALAGKGFNQDVENSYKAQGDLNYDEVDRIETIAANEEALLRFIKDGRLSEGE